MAIEIKELKVTFNVTDDQGRVETYKRGNMDSATYRKIVKECTDKVLRELERRTER